MSLRPAESPATEANARTRRAKLHPDVLKLGLVSFLTDLSSEMIFSVFAGFFTTVAGASTAQSITWLSSIDSSAEKALVRYAEKADMTLLQRLLRHLEPLDQRFGARKLITR